MRNRCCVIGCFFKQRQQDACALVRNFNNFAQLYITAVIYCFHGKLTVVWNFTSVNLTKVKSQTGLSSLRVSCKRDLIYFRGFYINFGTFWSFFKHFKVICLPESSLWLFLNFLKKRISKAVVVNLSFWQNLGYTQKKLQFWNISRKKICAGIT